jgi:hypothetical protein
MLREARKHRHLCGRNDIHHQRDLEMFIRTHALTITLRLSTHCYFPTMAIAKWTRLSNELEAAGDGVSTPVKTTPPASSDASDAMLDQAAPAKSKQEWAAD